MRRGGAALVATARRSAASSADRPVTGTASAMTMTLTIAWWLAACPAAGVAAPGAAAGAAASAPGGGVATDLGRPREAKPRWSLVPDRGFYDDAWALDGTGRWLAVLHTDRETFQRLELFDLDVTMDGTTPAPTGGSSGRGPSPTSGGGGGATAAAVRPATMVDLAPTRSFQALVFPPGASEPLLVSRAAEGEDDQVVLESIAAAATVPGNRPAVVVTGKTVPVSAFGFSSCRGAGPTAKSQTVLVVVQRRSGRDGEVTHVVTPLALPALNPAGKARSYVVAGDGTLRPQGLVVIGFFDGYSKLLGQKPGWYDKKKDVRQPDGMAVVDLLTGKLSSEGAIEDVYGWARTTRLRREHPDRTAFVQLADATAVGTPPAASAHRESGITLIDGGGHVAPLPLAVPFSLYDRSTLRDQEGPAPGLLHFGIQIDPVNPDAVRRQKSDRPYLDIYTVPLDGPDHTRLRARVAVDPRPVTWFVAGQRLVVSRKFKSFARGGDRLDVYDLAP